MNDEELNAKIKQIAQMLGQENVKVPENLGSIISMLANSSSKDNPPQRSEEQPAPQNDIKTKKEETSAQNNMDDNVEMMRKIKTIMDSMRNINDPRINLLTAIRPFLNSSRQKKISNCIKLFQMTQVTRMLTEMEKDNYGGQA